MLVGLAIGFGLGVACTLWAVGRFLDPIVEWLCIRKEKKYGVARL